VRRYAPGEKDEFDEIDIDEEVFKNNKKMRKKKK
jgi:hypothetical protein